MSGIEIENADQALAAARGTLESFRSINWGTVASESNCWMPVRVDQTTSTVDVEVWCGPVATPLDGNGWLKGSEGGNAIPQGDKYVYNVTNAPYNVTFSTDAPVITEGATILGEGSPAVNAVAPPAPVPPGWVVVDGRRIANEAELFDNLNQRFAEVRNQSPDALSQPTASCWLSNDSQTPNAICGPIRFPDDDDTVPPFIQFPVTFEPLTPSSVRATISEGGYNRAAPNGKLIERSGLNVDPPAVDLVAPTPGAPSTAPSTTGDTSVPADTSAPTIAVTLSGAPANVPWVEPAGPNRIVWYVSTEAGIDPGGELTLERWVRVDSIEASDQGSAIQPESGYELVGADVALVTDVLREQVQLFLDVDGQRTPVEADLAESGFLAGVPKSAASVTLAIDDGNAVQRFDLRSGMRVDDGNPAWYRGTNEIGLLVFTTAVTEVPTKSGIESWLTTLITERTYLSGFDADGKVLDPVSSDLVVVGRYEAGTAASPSVAVVTDQIDASYTLTLEDGTTLKPYAVTGNASRFRAYFHVPALIERAELSATVFSAWSVIDDAERTAGSAGSGAKGEPSVMQLDFGPPAPAG